MKHKMVQKGKGLLRKGLALLLAASLATSGSVMLSAGEARQIHAEERVAAAITSMNYFSASDGPVISSSGVGQASYGFVMPVFNGGQASWEDVVSDLAVYVNVNGSWIDIDQIPAFAYNSNWGNWNDGGFHGYWFTLSETTNIRLASKTNPGVTLEYTLEFTNLSKTTITSMSATQGPVIQAGVTGGSGFTYPVFNGDPSITYGQVAEDLKLFVWSDTEGIWVDLDNNAASGWIYDRNFGQFTDGGGGYWFTVEETTNVRLASESQPDVYLDYTINYNDPVRNTFTLSADTTTYTAGETGAIGIPLPYIDGGYPIARELDGFVYQIKMNGQWVDLGDYSLSGFSYQGNGYNNMSDKNQWGYWVDGIYGLWFQPIQENADIRVGYPVNGIKGNPVEDNYVYYTFIGNPDAPRPDVSDLGNITLGELDSTEIDGWNLRFNDEFNGDQLDTGKWNYNTGYYINNDPSMWGWGNNELEYYTDNLKNTYVKDGSLHLTAYEEPMTFPEIDPNRVAPYSSGKITTKDNFTFKYGRIDFRAKLPSGTGLWPALWMLPNDDTYGSWAASGELDVMEARGRLPGSTSGTIHFGGVWPANTYMGSDYSFENGETFDSDYHVYSAVWEQDNIKWYVDGKCFFKATSDQWYSLGAGAGKNAPFDQEFYIIMNLAVGGWFDGGLTPTEGVIPATMNVDYVRVYQEEGSTDGSFSDHTQGTNTVPVTGIHMDQSELTMTSQGAVEALTKSISPENATNKNVKWESSDPAVAAVSAGQVTAISNGTAVITATTLDGGFTASCTVTVNIPGGGSDQTITNVQGNEICGLIRTNDRVEFYVNNAVFADVHYKLNGGPQMNVAMNTADGSRFTYLVSGLNIGDTIEYFFTYNPGQGALDSAVFTFSLPAVSDTSEPVQPGAAEDVAAGRPVSCSGSENEATQASGLTDANEGTRWSSNFADDAWFQIDLGQSCQISRITLNWETSYGRQYELLVSEDGVNYTSIYRQTNGQGGIESINITPINAKYVKFQGIERAMPYGYSLWDVSVTGIKTV